MYLNMPIHVISSLLFHSFYSWDTCFCHRVFFDLRLEMGGGEFGVGNISFFSLLLKCCNLERLIMFEW